MCGNLFVCLPTIFCRAELDDDALKKAMLHFDLIDAELRRLGKSLACIEFTCVVIDIVVYLFEYRVQSSRPSRLSLRQFKWL